MTRRLAVGMLLTLALASCGGRSPGSSASMTAGGAASASSSGTLKPSSGPGTTPGRPYDAQAVLEAMRDSTRPGGVPDQLETSAIAEAVSRQVWTWDGQPWMHLSIGGACGPSRCSLDVAGSREDTPGADLYSFSVEAASGAVTLATSDLHAYPSRLDARLERAGKAAAGDKLDALGYIGARWLPPPDAGRYWLAYRSGGEEGTPGLDVLLDLASGEVIETIPV